MAVLMRAEAWLVVMKCVDGVDRRKELVNGVGWCDQLVEGVG